MSIRRNFSRLRLMTGWVRLVRLLHTRRPAKVGRRGTPKEGAGRRAEGEEFSSDGWQPGRDPRLKLVLQAMSTLGVEARYPRDPLPLHEHLADHSIDSSRPQISSYRPASIRKTPSI